MKTSEAPAGDARTLSRRLLGPDMAQAALLVAAMLLTLWHLCRFAEQSGRALAYGGTLDGQEGTLLYEARLIVRGEPLYQPLRPDRVVGAPYPPIHAYVLAATEALVGGGAQIFLPGRMISLLSTLGTSLALAAAVWRLSRSALVSLLAPALFLATAPVQLWATRIKPDPLGLLFTGAGLLCAAIAVTQPPGAPPRRRHLALIAAAALYAAAFFTKQTQVAAPVATGLALLLSPDRPALGRRAGPRAFLARRTHLISFGLSYLGLVGSAWLALDLATGGMFSFHVWGLHPPGWWEYERFIDYAGLLLPGWPLLLLLVAGAAGVAWVARAQAGAALLALAYGALGCATLVGSGTTGSNHNHLLEPYLALTLGGCAAAGWIMRPGVGGQKTGPQRLTATLAAALLLGQAISYGPRPTWYGGEFRPEEQQWQSFVNLIRSQPGEVLSDNVGLLLLAGKEPRYDDPATMGPAAASGIWDASGLVAEVKAQRFDLLLLPLNDSDDQDPSGRWQPEFIAALRASYHMKYRDELCSYVPIGAPSP